MSDPVTTLMWEAVAAPGRVDDVVEWAKGYAPDGLLSRETYVSADDRVVLVTDWRSDELARAAELTPPEGTLARDPHVWPFSRVDVLRFRA